MPTERKRRTHIKLTSHPGGPAHVPIVWGAADPIDARARDRVHHRARAPERDRHPRRLLRRLPCPRGGRRRARSRRAGPTSPTPRPPIAIGPHPQWSDPERIVSLDPWGAVDRRGLRRTTSRAGYDIRPTIAVTKAHVDVPEIRGAIEAGRLRPDGVILRDSGAALVTKVAIEPVWHLPGVARRFGCTEADLRRTLFEETGRMFPELVTRGDLEVFLPPIGGQTAYVFGPIGRARRSVDPAHRARARRVQRLRRVRLGHLHVPPVSRARHRGVHPRRPGGRRRPHRVLPEGRARPRRGDQVPRLQRAQAPGGRRPRRAVLRPHRVRGRRAGHALPGADARRAPLARRAHHPPARCR